MFTCLCIKTLIPASIVIVDSMYISEQIIALIHVLFSLASANSSCHGMGENQTIPEKYITGVKKVVIKSALNMVDPFLNPAHKLMPTKDMTIPANAAQYPGRFNLHFSDLMAGINL
jgi:hypothetical protein